MHGHERSGGIERLDRRGNPGTARGGIQIVIAAPPAGRHKERASAYLPWALKLALKVGLPLVVLMVVVVLPGYLECRGQRETGMFFHGMTVSACTRQTIVEQITGTQQRFEAIARAVAGR